GNCKGLGGVGLVVSTADASCTTGSWDGSPTIAKASDGMSNTIILSEQAARNQIWVKGQPLNPSQDTTTFFAKKYFLQLNAGGGAWADPGNTQWFDGGPQSGVPGDPESSTDPNSCTMNCNNLSYWGFYSFHPGTVHHLFGDGSVHGLNDKMSDYVFAS